jgi:hypothetical protein
MPVPFHTTNVRPENAVLVYSLNLTKNKTALWAMNGGGVLLLIFFGWLLLLSLQLIRPGIQVEIFSGSFNGWASLFIQIGVLLALPVVHELVHGIFFLVFTYQRSKFGFRGWYAFAAAPGWFIQRSQYLIVALAPFILLSVFGMILIAILPAAALAVTIFGVIVNAASSVGDLWITLKLICERRPIAVEDQGDGVKFYALS